MLTAPCPPSRTATAAHWVHATGQGHFFTTVHPAMRINRSPVPDQLDAPRTAGRMNRPLSQA